VRRIFLDVAPQLLNRIEVRRVGRQLVPGQAIGMGGKEVLHGFAGMVAGAILNQQKVLLGLGTPLRNRQLSFNLLDMEVEEVPL
jgi:hypothetical protein